MLEFLRPLPLALDRDDTSQEVVVPTGEVFIEALVGSEPLFADFELLHRAYDAQKARADAITAEIEALRRALRLEGGDTGDPDVDRYVKVDGLVNSTLPVEPS